MSTFPADIDAETCLLALVAKRPRPGLVKSRLAAATSPEWAARVATAFLGDLTQRFMRLPVERMFLFDPPEARDWFAQLGQDRYALAPQSSGDLGARLIDFLRSQFQQQDDRRIVLIGMDSPTLPLELVERAFAQLQSSQVVLGPATDGGYYLIGCRQFLPHLFAGINWSSHTVLYDTVARIRKGSLTCALLPPWYDVDTLEDWWMLRGHVAALRLAGMDVDLPFTEELLMDLDQGIWMKRE